MCQKPWSNGFGPTAHDWRLCRLDIDSHWSERRSDAAVPAVGVLYFTRVDLINCFYSAILPQHNPFRVRVMRALAE